MFFYVKRWIPDPEVDSRLSGHVFRTLVSDSDLFVASPEEYMIWIFWEMTSGNKHSLVRQWIHVGVSLRGFWKFSHVLYVKVAGPAVLECSCGGDSRAPTVAVRWCATTGGRCPGEASTWGPKQYLDKVVNPQLQLIDKVLAPRFDELWGGVFRPCAQVQGRGSCPQRHGPKN